jgi:MFS family permease
MTTDTTSAAPQSPPRFFYGWVIVALAAACSFWGAGVVQRSYAVILKPLTEDLGVPRTMGVLGVTIASLTADLASPFIGVLVDKRGVRLLVTLSAAVTGLTLMLLAQVHDVWLFLLLFGVVLGLARPSLQAVGAQTTVARWFVRRRGRAVTFSTLGLPLSAVVLIPFTQWMVAGFGWRSAWTVLGAGVLLALTAPVALFMRGRPEEMGLLPDGDGPVALHGGATAGGGAARPASGGEVSWETKEALHTRTFWLLSVAFAVIGMVPTIMTVHMFPYFTDQGLDPATAATAAGSFGIAVIGSRLLFWGYLFDRVAIQRTLMLWGLLMTVAISVMLAVHTVVLAFVAAACFGVAMGGTAPLGTLAWARYYGRGSLGAITGVASLIGIVNDILGPLMPSVVYDLTGSYHGAFVATAVGCLIGVALFAAAGPPRLPDRA